MSAASKDTSQNGGVTRVSISLSETGFKDLDRLVEQRGFDSRSQAIAEMIATSAIEHSEDRGNQIMAGTITLVYDESRGNLLQKLAGIEHEHIDEVISSLHIQLQDNHRMEVILVQGPARKLKQIANQLIACKGVRTGKLTLTTMIIPPLHPLPAKSFSR